MRDRAQPIAPRLQRRTSGSIQPSQRHVCSPSEPRGTKRSHYRGRVAACRARLGAAGPLGRDQSSPCAVRGMCVTAHRDQPVLRGRCLLHAGSRHTRNALSSCRIRATSRRPWSAVGRHSARAYSHRPVFSTCVIQGVRRSAPYAGSRPSTTISRRTSPVIRFPRIPTVLPAQWLQIARSADGGPKSRCAGAVNRIVYTHMASL